jgi:hypothetical protein
MVIINRNLQTNAPPNILKDIKKKGTFSVNPEDEYFVKKAKSAGLTEDQIMKGLEKKKQVLTAQTDETVDNKITNQLVAEGVLSEEEEEVFPQDNVDPFGGRSKQEVMQFAFQSGVKSIKALTEIGDVYDLVTGKGDLTDEEIKQENFAKAKGFIADNPDASIDELKLAIRQHTNLDVTDVSSLLSEAGVIKEEGLTEENLKAIAVNLVKKNTGFFGKKEEGVEKAKSQIDVGKIKINDKEKTLSSRQISRIKELIDEEFPEKEGKKQGRTLLQRLLPGGK